MYCHNCANVESFVLCVECCAVVEGSTFRSADWSLTLQCHACASTHVAGDPTTLL